MAGVVIVAIIGYLVLCAIVAWIGRGSRMGFWGVFICALIVTPFISFIFVILLGAKNTSRKYEIQPKSSKKP